MSLYQESPCHSEALLNIELYTVQWNLLIKDPPRKGQPPYKGHISAHPSHCTNRYFNLREEDSLSTKDKMAGPKVSCIWRFHCI